MPIAIIDCGCQRRQLFAEMLDSLLLTMNRAHCHLDGMADLLKVVRYLHSANEV